MGLSSDKRYIEGPVAASRFNVAAQNIVASSNSTAVDVEDEAELHVTMAIGTVTGTNPTLDVTVQASVDGTNWQTVGTFPQKTDANSDSSHSIAVAPLGVKVRYKWVIGGTDTPTFPVTFTATKIRR